MKKFLFLMLFLVVSNLYADNFDRILVVDVSGSMRKDNLHERVKKAFKEYVEKCKIGDRVIVMTFGSDVNPGIEDRVIQSAQDIVEIENKIDELEFRDRWTWMTKAFDIIFKRVEDLYKAYPEREKEIYIFTDGNNEPPPGHEDDFSFEEIIRKYGNVIERLGSGGKIFVYVVMFGIKPEEKLQKFAEEAGINIVEKPRSPSLKENIKEDIIKKISIFISPLNFEAVLKDSIVEDFTIVIKEMINVENVVLNFDYPKEILISPSVVKVSDGKIENDKFKIILINPKPGLNKYRVYLKSDEKDVQIQPASFVFEINVKKSVHIPLWTWLLPFIVLFFIVAVIFYAQFFCPRWPKGYYVVKKVKTEDGYVDADSVEIREKQKFCKSTVSSVELGFPEVSFELKIDRNGRVIKKVLEEEIKKEEEISSGNNIYGDYFFEIKEV